MFIKLLALHLSNKIAIGLYYLLQAEPDSAVGPLDILPGDVGKHFLDGGNSWCYLITSRCNPRC